MCCTPKDYACHILVICSPSRIFELPPTPYKNAQRDYTNCSSKVFCVEQETDKLPSK